MIDSSVGKIPLSSVAEIVSASGPNTINRENVKRRLVISANVADRDLRSTVDEIRKKIEAEVEMPENYYVTYGGQFESEAAASRTLMWTSLGALLIIFMLLFHEFGSVVQSVIILVNMPLAMIGGIWILVFHRSRTQYPCHYRLYIAFGYHHPQRYASDEPIQSPGRRGRRIARTHNRRVVGPSSANRHDGLDIGSRPYPACREWLCPPQRNPVAARSGDTWRTHILHGA